MPHGMCFAWRPDTLALHVISDALIALAYFSIPLLLARLLRARRDFPFSSVVWMFSIFIVSCGLTHVLSIVVIWYPIYWTEGIVKAITALASVMTAIALVSLLSKALALRTPAELEHVNDALRASIAESAALLARYDREHYIATTLQSASIGTVPERIGSIRFSAVYRPGVGDLEIGGDWYDAFQLPDGRIIISIGDVTGKGLSASVIMAKMRQAIRVAAQVQVAPSAILDAADRALRLEYPEDIVTAFVGIIDEGDRTISYASAGHPAPLAAHPDGSITELISHGLPLGLRDNDAPNYVTTQSLAIGSMLVLFTDGLTESTHDYEEGERRLYEALRQTHQTSTRDPALDILNIVLFDGCRDDVAIMTLSIGETPLAARRWNLDVGDGSQARSVRNEFTGVLRTYGADDEAVFASELIFSELIGNAVRHAPGLVEVRLDWAYDRPVLHVLDRGPGFQFIPTLPQDALAESGRGLFLIDRLARDFVILRRRDGGSHARVVLPMLCRVGGDQPVTVATSASTTSGSN